MTPEADAPQDAMSPLEIRQRFLERLGPETPFYRLFDLLPGVSFFAKDEQFRLVAANRAFYERLGFSSEQEIVGRDDFSLFPPHIAAHFREDDEEVLRGGQPKVRIVELFPTEQGLPDWFLTHKMPLRDHEGRVMGLMGIVQTFDERQLAGLPAMELGETVAYIRARFRRGVTVSELAERLRISERHLHRRFNAVFGIGPREFINRVRIQAACEELERRPQAPLREIARDLGFPTQSAFTQFFRAQVGMAPLQWRQRAVERSFHLAPGPGPS